MSSVWLKSVLMPGGSFPGGPSTIETFSPSAFESDKRVIDAHEGGWYWLIDEERFRMAYDGTTLIFYVRQE